MDTVHSAYIYFVGSIVGTLFTNVLDGCKSSGMVGGRCAKYSLAL